MATRRLIGLIAIWWAGCQCPDQVQNREADVVWKPQHRLIIEGDEALLDFGLVPFSAEISATVELENRGAGRAEVTDNSAGNGPVITWNFQSGTLAATESLPIIVHFAPRADAGELSSDFSAELAASAIGTPQPRQLRLRVTGSGYAFACQLPDAIDFGTTLVGSSVTHEILFENPSDSTLTIPLEAADADEFSWVTPSPLEVAPRSQASATLRFHPLRTAEYLSVVRLVAGPGCVGQAVRLHGVSVNRWIDWAPDTIDCGWVQLDETRSVELRFHNYSEEIAHVTNLLATGPATVVDAALELAPGGDVSTVVACNPLSLGPQFAELAFMTSFGEAGLVPILMKGGGPKISVEPSPVVFGSTAVGVPTTRHVAVRNVGTRVPDAGFDSNLHLENDGQFPLLRVLSGSGAVVSSASPYSVVGGIAAGDRTVFELTVTPTAPGPWLHRLVAQSNDPTQPAFEIPVSGTAVSLPPCQLRLSTQQLNFGLLYSGERRELEFTIENRGSSPAERCLLSAVDIDLPGQAQGYELVGGRLEAVDLQAGSSLALRVAVTASSLPAQQLGVLSFQASNAQQPLHTVNLTATTAPRCAVVEPSPLFFGPVPINCTARRMVTIYNACATDFAPWPLSIAGESFTIDAGIPPVLTASQSYSTSVAFLPQDAGLFEAELTVGGPGGLRAIPISGTGVMGSQVTESFVQPTRAELDLLYSINVFSEFTDGGGPTNAAINSELTAIASRLIDAGVDLRTGVIWGEWDRVVNRGNTLPWTMGELIRPDGGPTFGSGTSADTHVIQTLNYAPEAYRNSRGTFSNREYTAHFEAILRAIDLPLAANANLGFRRPGVHLGIVIQNWNDERSTHFREDPAWFSFPDPYQVPLSPSYYWSRLSAVAGGPSRLSISALTTLPGEPSCSEPYDDDPLGRLQDMASLSGGVAVDVCGADLAASFGSIRQTLSAFNRSFVLVGLPDNTAPMVVRVAGLALPLTEWSYSALTRSVVLTSAPGPGAIVEVTYVPLCE